MAEQERLLANDQEGLKSQAVSESSSSWSCCCRSGPLRYADVGEAAEDAANALIAELSVQPTMWSPEAKDARVVDAVQRIWMAIASENPHILRLAPPRLPSKDWRRIGFQGDDPYTDMRGAGLAGFTYIARLAEEYAEARMIGASGEQGEVPFGIAALNVLWMLRCHLQLFSPTESPPAFCPCCGAAGVAQEYGPRQPHRGRHIRGFAMLLLDDRDAWINVFALSFLVTAALWRKRGETMLINSSSSLSGGHTHGSASVRSSLTGASGPGGMTILAGGSFPSPADSTRKDRSRSRRSSSKAKSGGEGGGMKLTSSSGHLDAMETSSSGGGGMRPASSSGQLTDDVAAATRSKAAAVSGTATETATASGEVRSASGSISQASASLIGAAAAGGALTVVQRTGSSSSASHLGGGDAASSSPSTHHHDLASSSSSSGLHSAAGHLQSPSRPVGDLRLLQFNSILHEAQEVIMEALATFPPDITALRATLFRKLKAKGLASSSSASSAGVSSASVIPSGTSAPSPYYHQYYHNASGGGGGGEMLPYGQSYDDESLAVPQPVPPKSQPRQGRPSASNMGTNSTLKASSIRPVPPYRPGMTGAGRGDDEHLLYVSASDAALASSYAGTTPPFGTSPGVVAGSWQAQAGPAFAVPGHPYGPVGGHGVSTAAKWGSRAGGLHATSDLNISSGLNNAGYEIEG